MVCTHTKYLCAMQNTPKQLIETRQATVERVSKELIELRIKPDVKLDAEGVGEFITAKRALCGMDTPDILASVPADLDFELNLLAADHNQLNGGCANSRRLAFAANSGFNQRLLEIYFRYHPRPHPTRVFLEEGDAREWLLNGMEVPSMS